MRLVGIVLVRNEDVFVEQAVRNVAGVCDELLLFDHRSRDETPEILAQLAAEVPQATFEAVDDPAVTHACLQPYVGTDTWVLGVDGDELYEPAGLAVFRARLETGELDRFTTVKGIQLHARALNDGTATGWLAPPARSTTKLFNFAAIDSWEGENPERLHGTGLVLNRPERVAWVRDEGPWESASFRCLHVCFLRRSSLDRGPRARVSYVERIADGRRARVRRYLRDRIGHPEESWWKLNKYRQGPEVSVRVDGFL